MQFFSKTFQSLRPKIDSFTLNTQNTLLKLQNYSHKIIYEHFNRLINISNNLYYMPFPTQQIQQDLKQQIKNKCGSSYYIWNISEIRYPTQIFNNQVSQTCYPGYPNLPLSQLLLLVSNIKKWISEPGNSAIVHCKQNRSRSGILLAVYLYLDNKYEYLDEALIEVNRKLGINKQETFFPSQRLCIKNCMNLFNGISTNKKSLKLLRIMMNQYPKLIKHNKDGSLDQFKPFIELISQNTKLLELLPIASDQDREQNLSYEINKIVHDDFLIWVKHYHNSKIKYSCIRVLCDTNFINQSYIRVNFKDIDIATTNIKISHHFFIDLFFQVTETNFISNLSMAEKQARRVFKSFKLVQNQSELRKTEKAILQQELYKLEIQKQLKQIENHENFDIEPKHAQKRQEILNLTQNVHKIIENINKQKQIEQQDEDIDDYISKLQQQTQF